MKMKTLTLSFLLIQLTTYSQNVRTSEQFSGLAHFSPDGKSILSTSGQFFDLRTGKTATDLNYKGTDQDGQPTYFEAGFSESGKFIAYNRKVYDGTSAKPVIELPERAHYTRHFQGYNKHWHVLNDLNAVAFSDDDKRVLAADEIFDLSTKKNIATLKPVPYRAGIRHLLHAGNTRYSVKSMVTIMPRFNGFSPGYEDAFSPDISYMIVNESGKKANLNFFELTEGEVREQYDELQNRNSLWYTPETKLVGKNKLDNDFDEDNVHFSLNGNLMAIIDGTTIKIFDITNGKLKTRIASKDKSEWDKAVLSASGKLLAAISKNTLSIFSSESGKLIRELDAGNRFASNPADEFRITDDVFSYNDAYLINGYDGSVIEISTGQTLGKVPFFNRETQTMQAKLTSNNRAVFTYSDGSARVFDANTGNELFTDQIGNPNTIFFTASENGKWAAACNWQGELSIWNDQSATPIKTWQPHGGKPTGQIIFDTPNNQLFTYSIDNILNTYDLSNFDLKKSVKPEKPVNQLYALPNELLARDAGTLYLVDYETGKLEKITDAVADYHFSDLIFHPQKHLVFIGKYLFEYRLKQLMRNFELYRPKAASWDKMKAIGTTKKEPWAVYTISDKKQLARWDFTTGQVAMVKFETTAPKGTLSTSGFDRVHSQPAFDKIVAAGNADFFDFSTKTFTNPFAFVNKTENVGTGYLTDYYQISADGKRVALSKTKDTNYRILNIYNAQTGQITATVDAGTSPSYIMRGFFSPTADTVYFGIETANNKELAMANAANGQIMKRVPNIGFEIKYILVSPNANWVVAADGWKKFVVYDKPLTTKLFEGETSFAAVNAYLSASPDGKHFSITNQDGFKGGKSAIINLQNKTIREVPGLHYYVNFSPDGKYLYSIMKEQKADTDVLTVYNVADLSMVTTCMQLGIGSNNLIYTNERFYNANKDALKEVHFSEDTRTYLFDQFDLRFNRPDMVLKALGYADAATLSAYKKAWEKRVRKMGFDPKLFDGFETKLNTPELALLKEVPQNTTQAKVEFNFAASDKLYTVERLHIYANGTPIFGTIGKPVKTMGKKTANGFELSIAETVELLPGKNMIEISVTNEQGIESVRERFEISYNAATTVKPNLYILAIGVSNFFDNRMNLAYAAKDADDISQLFGTKTDQYNEIKVLKFTNEEATREKVMKAKAELQKTRINDEVIVFVASHGLLDNQLDYYIAMHDMAFDDPGKRGLKYEDLESLLDGIPARQKLMFIDACHSGEVDKEEVELADATVKQENGVSSRGFKTVQNKKGIGLKTSFELMKELFADLRRGTGAVVISSASGKEYAYESDEWKNGVFTFSLIEGIKSGKADINGNKQIAVSELQNYVIKRVSDLTNGKQTPTTRIEKIDMDFRVW